MGLSDSLLMKTDTPTETDMNATQFKSAIDTYCEGLVTVAIGCGGAECEHSEGNEDHSCEASFSWVQCDSCGSTLGGDRLPAFGLWRDEAGELCSIAMDVCIDCAMFHANGETPTGDANRD